MNKVIESLAFFASSKMIHKTMDTSLNIQHINELIDHEFDKNKEYFLYIHIPFCHEFCSFCSFHKFKYEANVVKEYFLNLRLELKKLKDKGVQFNTAYIGGGTPLIDDYELAKTIELIKELFNIEDISCETTPNNIKKEVLEKFEGLISRLSIGVQSFSDEILKMTGRYEKYGSSQQIEEKIENIKGILPITSIDLIFNFPNQTKEMLVNDLKIAKKLDIEQIVTYPLMTSKLRNANTLKHFQILKESSEYDFYKTIQDELKSYHMNNSWAFSKNIESLADEYVVDNSEYIGVGSGAFTYLNNQLFVNAYDLQQYKYMINNHTNSNVAMSSTFEFKNKIQYQFLLHLFGGKVDIKKLSKLVNAPVEDILKKEIFMLKMIKAIEIKKGIIYPTPYGNFLTLIMMREFYSGMDAVRAKLRRTMLDYKNTSDISNELIA